MDDWTPEQHHPDPMVNAVLNVARELASLSSSVNGLLYGLKYSKDSGMSIAEAIEVAAQNIADHIGDARDE